MDKLKNLIVLFVLINTQFISAQQTINLDETVFVHANASTFVTGEALLYKIYCLKPSDKTPSLISKIAYVELVDSESKSVFKTKIQLENATGQGDYFIPTTLKTGAYKLIGYTNWMLNNPTSETFQIDITIINPYIANTANTTKIKADNATVAQSIEKKENSDIYTNENLKFKLDKKVFSNRELVNLQFETLNKISSDGNYSLSVRKIDDLKQGKTIKAVDFSTRANSTIIDLTTKEKKIILPELRGEFLSGKVTAKNNTDKVENLNIAFSLPGKSYVFQVSKTDSNGNFIFNFDSTNYNSNVVVQIIDKNAENYTISLDKSPEIDYSKLSFEVSDNLSYIYRESLLNRSISSQIENAYFYKKTDSFVKPVYEYPFYSTFSKEYILDNYTRFKTINETATEIAIEIFSKKTNNNFYLHVMDYSTYNQLPEPALVLFDGLLLQNQNDLLNYNMKNIYKINLIPGRYYVGPKSFNGLISFTSFENDFESKLTGSFILKTNILRPQLKKVYHKINYSNPAENEQIPDFRNQLFWNPEVKINDSTNNTFYTSDLSGTYEIRLEGFTKNGVPISLKEIIEVNDSTLN